MAEDRSIRREPRVGDQALRRTDPQMEERGISGDAALLAGAALAAPVVNAWAQQHFGSKPVDSGAPDGPSAEQPTPPAGSDAPDEE